MHLAARIPLAVVLMLAVPLAAEEPQPPLDGSAAVEIADVPRQSEQITVTAKSESDSDRSDVGTKTDTPLRDVPQSIQVVPGEVLRAQGATQLNDSIRNVSGVTQSSSSNYGFFNNYIIRGLQQTFLRNGIADGTTINGYARTLTGVERVEVLKGPGSALYGTTAPGGTVNLVLRAPSSNAGWDLVQTAGSFDTRTTSIGLTGPLGSTRALYRLDASYATSDGDRDLGSRSLDVLPRFTFLVSDRSALFLDLGYQSIDVQSDTYGIPFRAGELLDVPRANKYYTPFGNTEQEIVRAAIRDETMIGNALSLRANASFIHRDLYLARNAGGAINPGTTVQRNRSLRQQTDVADDALFQIEPVWSLSLGSTQHVVLAGFEAQRHDIDTLRSTAALPSIADVFHPVIPETSSDGLRFTTNFDRTIVQNQTSVYLQDQIEVTPRLKVRVGGRLDRFSTDDDDRTTGVLSRHSDAPFSGQAGIVYQPSSVVSLFAGASKGHFAILSTETAVSARPSESATQYEMGTKLALFGGRLQMNAALFRVSREDFLVTINGEPQPVGEQRTDGVELDLMGNVTSRLRMAVNWATQDATLISVPVTPPAAPVDGKRPTGVPRHSASAWASYDLPAGLRIGGGITYRDFIYFDQLNTQRLPSYVLGDAMLGYRLGAIDLQLNVRNITDREWFRNGMNSGALPGEPRTFLLMARVAR